jgi:hypothetical protein
MNDDRLPSEDELSHAPAEVPVGPEPRLTSRILAQRVDEAVGKVVARATSPTARRLIRYVIGAVAAIYVLVLGYLAVMLRPTRDITYRAFNGLPRLIYGGDAPMAGIVAPDRTTRAPRWWWLLLAGWWLGLLWLPAVWLLLLTPRTVLLAMSMLAAADAVIFWPRDRAPSAIVTAPAESLVLPSGAAETRPERSPILKSIRFRVLDRDGYRCQYCGRSAADGVRLHIDHVVAVSRGGSNDESNLLTACQDCNLGKGARVAQSDPRTAA